MELYSSSERRLLRLRASTTQDGTASDANNQTVAEQFADPMFVGSLQNVRALELHCALDMRLAHTARERSTMVFKDQTTVCLPAQGAFLALNMPVVVP